MGKRNGSAEGVDDKRKLQPLTISTRMLRFEYKTMKGVAKLCIARFSPYRPHVEFRSTALSAVRGPTSTSIQHVILQQGFSNGVPWNPKVPREVARGYARDRR
jgi:hypothetical protein